MQRASPALPTSRPSPAPFGTTEEAMASTMAACASALVSETGAKTGSGVSSETWSVGVCWVCSPRVWADPGRGSVPEGRGSDPATAPGSATDGGLVPVETDFVDDPASPSPSPSPSAAVWSVSSAGLGDGFEVASRSLESRSSACSECETTSSESTRVMPIPESSPSGSDPHPTRKSIAVESETTRRFDMSTA